MPDAEAQPSPLHMLTEQDDCCAAALWKAIGTGKLDKAESWTHRKCGCEWRSLLVDGVIRWAPVTTIQIWR